MRILFLAHRIPYPPNKGDKIRSFNILKFLAARHEVHLACLIDDAADRNALSGLQSVVKSVVYDEVHPQLDKLLALTGMVHDRPITVSYFYSRRLQEQIDALCEREGIDACVCSSSPTAEYLFRTTSRRLRAAHRVMDFIDVDSLKWRQYADQAPLWTAWIYRYEARTLAEYEQRIAAEYDDLLVVSEQEKSYFPGRPPANLRAIPNGVDLKFFAPRPRAATTSPTIVFTGVMDYWPNVEGVKWFVERIFPQVRAEVPDVAFYIVGSRPTAEVRCLEAVAGVVVTGFVDDVRDYLDKSAVCVVPLRIARGIQNKLLEAMACGKAVVTTPQAFEGLNAQAGQDVLVAENETEFARVTIELLRDSERAASAGRRARLCMEQHYSWEQNLSVLEGLLRNDARQGRMQVNAR